MTIFPARFIERYQSIIPDFSEFLSVLQKPLLQSFRINTLKTNTNEILSRFADIKTEQIPWYEFGFRLKEKVNLGDRVEHKNGLIYIQESVSMLPAIVLESKPHEKILDMTAAPGSKTTQIAEIMKNTGLIVANDLSLKRIGVLIDNIERMEVINTVITKYAGQKLGYLMPEYFDRVLLDAPCSLEGTIRNTPQVLTNWKETTIKRLSKLQKGLINSAYKCLKKSGILVYSTCTFAPEENEAVIDYLLKKNPDAVCEPIKIDGLKTRPTVLNWRESHFDNSIKNTIRVYPQDNDTEGFYIAKIKKTY